MSKLMLAQVSDTHILPDPRGELRGRRLLPRLERIVDRIGTRVASGERLDLVVFTGDQVQDVPEAYPTFLGAIAQLNVPVAFVPGNHDHRDGFARYLSPLQGAVPANATTVPSNPGTVPSNAGKAPSNPGAVPSDAAEENSLFRCLHIGSTRILLLDSLWDGQVEGRIGPRQLEWIDATLRNSAAELTLVFVHHPPIPTGVDWLDPHVITDGDELVEILSTHAVESLFFGHVHQPMTLRRAGLVAVSAPATSFGFGGDGKAPVILEDPPALRWIEVDGRNVRSRVETVG